MVERTVSWPNGANNKVHVRLIHGTVYFKTDTMHAPFKNLFASHLFIPQKGLHCNEHLIRSYYKALMSVIIVIFMMKSSFKNIATGETSQSITPFHFFDNFNFHH